MKCGKCRKRNAASYTKIFHGHKLFGVLETLMPGRLFTDKNSYFCGECITLATNLKKNQKSLLSDQNAKSLSHIATSTTETVSSSSTSNESVFRDNNQTVPRSNQSASKKRNTVGTIQKENQPKPKRFKIGPKSKTKVSAVAEPEVTEATKPDEVSNSTEGKSSQSQSMSEDHILLNIIDPPDSQASTSSSQVLIQHTSPVIQNRGRIQYESETSSIDTTPNFRISETSKNAKNPKPSKHTSIGSTVPDVESSFEIISPDNLVQSNTEPLPVETERFVPSTAVERQQPITGASAPTTTTFRIRQKILSRNTTPNSSVSETSKNAENPNQSKHTSIGSTAPDVESLGELILPGNLLQSSSMSSTTETERVDPLTVVEPIAGPSAPIAKNPRIRQPNTVLLEDIRNYFQHRDEALNVNNYSRTLAG